jgi:uncharacterized membrane protein
MRIVFEHVLPAWLLVGLAGAAVVVAYLTYAGTGAPVAPWQRWSLRGLRASALLLLVGCLGQPVSFEPATASPGAVVAILIDVSRSMGLADHGDTTRLARARELVERRLLPALAPHVAVEVLSFGDRLAAASLDRLEPTARRSDLVGALRAVQERYAGRPLAGVVVVSDGNVTGRGRADVPVLEAPVFTVGVGRAVGIRDREVLSVAVGDTSLPGSTADLVATVVSRGFPRGPVHVTLREDDRLVQVRAIDAPPDGTPVPVVFSVAPPLDRPVVYAVEVAPDAQELAFENNTRRLAVGPAGRRRRVLLVEGAPGFEHSFLKRALEADPGLEVDALVRKGQNERGVDTYYVQAAATRAERLLAGYPSSREALFEYDAVVFANVEAAFFTRDSLALTADFVAERGGGLLVLGAQAFEHQSWVRTPIEDLLPVEIGGPGGLAVRAADYSAAGRFRLLLTPAGLRHPIFRLAPGVDETRRQWASLPALASAAALGGPKPGATVLAEVASEGGIVRPLLAVQRYGEGRTAVFSGEGAWRWKMRRPSGDRLYETFWRQVVRWLVAGAPEPVNVRVPAAVTVGEAIPTSVTVRDAAFAPVAGADVRVRVTPPGGPERVVVARAAPEAVGRYDAAVPVEASGLYRVDVEASRGREPLGSTRAVVLAGDGDEEFADPRMDEATLERVARASGGTRVDADSPEAVEGLARALAGRIPAEAVLVRRELWHSPWTFLGLLVVVCGEWTLRRRWGWR